MQALLRVFRGLAGDRFFLILLAALLVLAGASPTPIAAYPSLVDGGTLAALTGLLLLTKGLELSGVLQRLGLRLVRAMPSERAIALSLVLAAAVLSMVLTNDVALFVVVPLTLGVCRLTSLPSTRLIVFEALAVNAGSALTPIGNPQNLFLWQLAKVSFGEFMGHQAPLVAALLVGLAALTWVAFGRREVHLTPAPETPLDGRLLGLSACLYAPFLVAADFGHASWAVAVLLVLFLVGHRRVVLDLDWGLLLVFALMFIDLRLLAQLPAVKDAMAGLDLQQPLNLYLVSIGASQLISNVPAAIALSEYTADWRVLAYGVNVGGFGFMVGSLANLIALRMSGDARAWRLFHAYAVPALLLSAVLGAAGLHFMGCL
ncbi:SLC13 family permease [Roseateles puraquae]|uniref:Anion transporter n=1 Tax=Roseateles puraquae TaxID=431059 RepID=A0A254NK03_9BURK|nr:SLC13 family permease [Roseateles puraquae]MDG0852865.1 anion transporter [Roseateles puraquae]OWR05133.1 anion transporter [Roseateles puraquae]